MWLKKPEVLPEQREKVRARAASSTTLPRELSVPSPIGKTPSEVGSPPRSVAGVEQSVYREGWEQAMQLELHGHLQAGTC